MSAPMPSSPPFNPPIHMSLSTGGSEVSRASISNTSSLKSTRGRIVRSMPVVSRGFPPSLQQAERKLGPNSFFPRSN